MHNRCIEPIKRIGLHRGGAIDRALICLNKMIALPHTLFLMMMHLYPNRLAVGVKNTYASSCPTADSCKKNAPTNTTTVMQITVAGARTRTPGQPTCTGKTGRQLPTNSSIQVTKVNDARKESPEWRSRSATLRKTPPYPC